MQTASKRTNIFVSFVHSNKINTKKKMFFKTVVKMRWQNGWYEEKRTEPNEQLKNNVECTI